MWCDLTEAPWHVPYYGPCMFGVRYFRRVCGAFWMGATWRTRAANVLRKWADLVEHKDTITLDLQGPLTADWEMGIRALEYGICEATKKFNEFHARKKTVSLSTRNAEHWDDQRMADDGYPVSWNRFYRWGVVKDAFPGSPGFWANVFIYGEPIPAVLMHHNVPVGGESRKHLPTGRNNTVVGFGVTG